MTALNQTVQHGAIPTRYNQFAAGQKASSSACKIKSGRYHDESTNIDHPLKFGYGCGVSGFDGRNSAGGGGDGGLVFGSGISRDTVFAIGADINTSVTSIAWDNDGASTDVNVPNLINAGDFVVINTEVMYVTGVGAAAITVVRGQKGTTAASHSNGDSVRNLNGRSNFAGVVLRDLTTGGRFNTSEVDAFINGEIVPVMYDGDIVCSFYEAVVAADIGKPISVIGDGSSAGLFRTGTDDAPHHPCSQHSNSHHQRRPRVGQHAALSCCCSLYWLTGSALTMAIRALDQAQMTFVESQAAHIEAETMRQVVADRMYPDLVPIKRDIDPGNDSIVSNVALTPKGKIQPLANMAGDSPTVTQDYLQIRQTFTEFGVSYGWSMTDIERARAVNSSLESDTVRAAVEIVEDAKEDIVMNGRSEYGWTGLLQSGTDRQPGTLQHPVTGGHWSTKTTEDIIKDLQDGFEMMATNSNQKILPDTLLLPQQVFKVLTLPLANSNGITSVSVMEYLRTNNPYTAMTQMPMTIKIVPRLAQGTAVFYKYNQDILRFLMPRELEFIGPQQDGYNFKWYGRVKMGGIQWLRPHGVLYMTGIA